MSLNAPTEAFLNALDARLPNVLSAVEPHYLEEPRGLFNGRASALARPRNADEVSVVLTACNAEKVGVVPYGGGTGLVGGQVSESGVIPLLLSMERMNAIRHVSSADQSMVVEAGVILSDVQAAADDVGLLFPLSLASEGSCRIGGNLATNAGGVNVVRWETPRDLCLGLEAVLADGTIINGLKSLRKDNTGYDLRHLLIGSEGSLGVITAAQLRLFPKPVEVVTALVDVSSPQDALALFHSLQAQFGELISAFELIDDTGVGFIKDKIPTLTLPPVRSGKWKILVELGSGPNADLQTRFEEALANAMDAGLVQDGHIAQSEAQRQVIWTMRESIPEANRLVGAISSHDISVPTGQIPEFIETASDVVSGIDPALRVNCFGHLGDGQSALQCLPPTGRDKTDFGNMRVGVKTAIHDLVNKFDGSFSAEHGVGRLKVSDLQTYGDPGKLKAINAIKSALDPNGIMNPGVIV